MAAKLRVDQCVVVPALRSARVHDHREEFVAVARGGLTELAEDELFWEGVFRVNFAGALESGVPFKSLELQLEHWGEFPHKESLDGVVHGLLPEQQIKTLLNVGTARYCQLQVVKGVGFLSLF